MRVFVTGASGWIGSALTPKLLQAGHEVVGLARSDSAAEAITMAGATALRGSLEDLDILRAGAGESEGVVHLGFVHDFARYHESVDIDRAAIEAMGDVLVGTAHPFLIASGMATLARGPRATEGDSGDPNFPRAVAAEMTLALADRGVRSGVVRLPPTVHGEGDAGFIATLVAVARERGVSAHVGSGTNCWSAVHRLDAAHLFHRALDDAPPGSVVHAVADEAVPTRTIAELIGRHLDLPVSSIAPEEAATHFGWIGMIFAHDMSASSDITRELLGWEPVELGLLEDLDAGHYFDPSRRPVVLPAGLSN
jgi:nucleoside-diphosphate-sugar epimerase